MNIKTFITLILSILGSTAYASNPETIRCYNTALQKMDSQKEGILCSGVEILKPPSSAIEKQSKEYLQQKQFYYVEESQTLQSIPNAIIRQSS